MSEPEGSPKEVPQSPALAEAQADSLAELLSRDPEGYQKQDLQRVIEAMRMQRARLEQGEEQAKAEGKKVKATKVGLLATKAAGTAEDLGL
jgi:hypothetical protein